MVARAMAGVAVAAHEVIALLLIFDRFAGDVTTGVSAVVEPLSEVVADGVSATPSADARSAE